MKKISICMLLTISAAVFTFGQTPAPNSTDTKPDAAVEPQDNTQYVRPTPKVRAKRYFNSMFGPTSVAKTVAMAGIQTWRNSPEEWGPHWEGFGRRVASGFGRSILKNSIQYGLDEALKLDSHYYRSKKKDVKSRIFNALISPVTARTASGKRVVGIPRIAASYSSVMIANQTWMPERYDFNDAIRRGTISLGFTAGFNLIKEFIWKK